MVFVWMWSGYLAIGSERESVLLWVLSTPMTGKQHFLRQTQVRSAVRNCCFSQGEEFIKTPLTRGGIAVLRVLNGLSTGENYSDSQ
jgi:hypothetical protein